MNESNIDNKQLVGLLNEEHKQAIQNQIDKIKPFALESRFTDIKELIAELGNFKNLIDIDKEVERINNSWNTFGISDEFYEALETFRDKINNKIEEFVPIQDRFIEYYQDVTNHQGISFLHPQIDKLTGGMLPGTLTTIVGGPGSMKTTTAMNIAYKAIKDGKNVCYFSLEETPEMLYSKLLSRASVDALPNTPITTTDILRNELSDNRKDELLNKVKPYLDSLPGKLFIVGEGDLAELSCFEFENKMKEIDELIQERTKYISANKSHGIDLVVLDHVQLLKYSSLGEDEFKAINRFVSFFRRQSLSFLGEKRQVAVMLLSQVNREGMKYAQKHDGEYLMQHVAEASEVFRASTYMISVYADALTQTTKQLKMGAVKIRNGAMISTTLPVYADGSLYVCGETLNYDKEYNEEEVLAECISNTEYSNYSEEDLFANGTLEPLE